MVMHNKTQIDIFAKSLQKIVNYQRGYNYLLQMGILVWHVAAGYIELVVSNARTVNQLAVLQCIIQKKIKFFLVAENLFNKRLQQVKNYIVAQLTEPQQWCQSLLANALSCAASDVHIVSTSKCLTVKLRIDGVLQQREQVQAVDNKQAINYLKILANCDIAESRRPQDGRFSFKHDNMSADVRLNACPTLSGEKIALRVLDNNKSINALDNVGMAQEIYSDFKSDLEQTSGLMIVTGPTGSGKTSTLYAAIAALNCAERHIITIENPVEYNLPGVNQIAVNNASGLSFNAALRASLRQDPDVILIGEIRDVDTAAIAIEAALTGHLVLTTLHTRNAWQAIVRLKQLGIAADLISSSLRSVTAQRLCRKLCAKCAGVGCNLCVSGYSGRVGVFEYLPMQQAIQLFLMSSLMQQPKDLKYYSFTEHAQTMLQAGITNRSELLRVFGQDIF